MASRSASLAAALGVFSAAAFWLVPPPVLHPNTEDDLQRRMDKEKNPVKKAKYEFRLGRLKLERAVAACVKDEQERCQQFLDDYLGLMKSSWERLRATGRQAVKQPQGFKELELALREDERLLEDLKQRVPYADRERIDKVEKDTDLIWNEVLKALFPAVKSSDQAPPRPARRSGPPGQAAHP